MDRFGVDRNRIMGMLILRFHFNICCAGPYLQKAYPHWEIMGSKRTEKFFCIEKAVKNIAFLDKEIPHRYGVDNGSQGI